MINRQQLQREIDELLNSITDEEIVAWYDSKTQIDIHSYLGVGSLLEIKPCSEFVQTANYQTNRQFINISIESADVADDCFGIAA